MTWLNFTCSIHVAGLSPCASFGTPGMACGKVESWRLKGMHMERPSDEVDVAVRPCGLS